MDETYDPASGSEAPDQAAPINPNTLAASIQQQWLVDRVDWDVAVDEYLHATADYTDTTYNDLGSLLSLAAKTHTELSALDVKTVSEELRRLHGVVTERELLRHADRRAENSVEPPDIQLRDIPEWTRLTKAVLSGMPANDRTAGLRQQLNVITAADQPLSRLGFMTSWLLPADERAQQQIPEVIRHALDRAASSICRAFDESDPVVQAQAANEHSDMPDVSNADVLQVTTDIKDPEAWLRSELSTFPEWYRAGLTAITCVANDTAGEAEGRKLAGHYDPTSRAVTVSAEQREYEHFMATVPPEFIDEPLVRAHYSDLVEGKLVHELSEHAWANTLNIAQKREWLRVREVEDKAVSVYILDTADERPSQLVSEDFCETMRLYMTAPDDLLWRAPARFDYAQALLGR